MKLFIVALTMSLLASAFAFTAMPQNTIADTSIAILSDRVERFRDDARQYRDRAAPLEQRARTYARRADRLKADLRTEQDPAERNDLEASIARYSALADDLRLSATLLAERAQAAEREALRADTELQKIIALQKAEAGEHARVLAEQQAARDARSNAFDYQLSVNDVVGIWRPNDGEDWSFTLVQEQPFSDLYPYRLEIHSNNRVWQGEYEPSERGNAVRSHQARMRFSYRPTAAEMNPEIPEWARAKLEGKLEWVMEIDEAGDVANPKLAVRWYPGEVVWQDDDRVSIVGRGIPLEFDLIRETHMSIFETGQAYIWIEKVQDESQRTKLRGRPPNLANERIKSILKGQPFLIKVRIAQAQANNLGDRIYAYVKTEDGESVRLPLLRRTPNDMGPVLFSLDTPVTVNNRGSESDRSPRRGSFEWFGEAFGIPEGRRLKLDFENKDVLTVNFGTAEHAVLIYDNVFQHGIDQHLNLAAKILESKALLEENPDLFRNISSAEPSAPNTPNSQSASPPIADLSALAFNEQMVQNYLTLMRQDDLLEIHKFYLGKLYLSKVGSLGAFTTFEEASAYLDLPMYILDQPNLNEVYGGRPELPQKSAYLTATIQGFIAALRGRSTDPVAIRFAERVPWTSEAEKGLVALALASASDDYAQSFERVIIEIAYSVPRALTQEASIWLFQRNLNGKFVSSTRRDLVKSRTILTVLLGAATNGGVSYLSRLGTMPTIGPLRRLKDRTLRPLSQPVLSVSGLSRVLPDAPPVRQPHAVSVDLSGRNLPTSLSTRQKNSIAFELGQFSSAERIPPCRGARPRGVDDLLDGEDLGSLSRDRDYYSAEGRSLFGENTEYIESPELYPAQTGGTCVVHSMINSIETHTGRKIDPGTLIAEAIELERDVLHPRAVSGELTNTPFAISDNVRIDLRRSDLLLDWFENIGSNPQTATFRAHLEYAEKFGFFSVTGRHLLRKHGASVASVNPARNNRTHVSHIAAALDDGYEVRVMLDLSPVVGEQAFHVIKMAGIRRAASDPRMITHVYVHESNVGGRVFRIPAKDFQNLIARNPAKGDPLDFGNMEVVNWGNRAVSRRTWRSPNDRPDPDLADIDFDNPTTRPPRMRSVDEMMNDLYPNGGMPEIHVTSLSRFRAIRRSGQLELADSGASFSAGGNVGASRLGDIAIRVRPEFANNVEFIDHFAGKIAFWWPEGIGNGRRYSGFIPNRALQYLNPETGQWNMIATR